jgi:hypothetical protein
MGRGCITCTLQVRWNACFAARLLVESDAGLVDGEVGWGPVLAEALDKAATDENLKIRIQVGGCHVQAPCQPLHRPRVPPRSLQRMIILRLRSSCLLAFLFLLAEATHLCLRALPLTAHAPLPAVF